LHKSSVVVKQWNNKINDIKDWATLDRATSGKLEWEKKKGEKGRDVIPMIYVSDVIFCVAREHVRSWRKGVWDPNRCFSHIYQKKSAHYKLYHYTNLIPAMSTISRCMSYFYHRMLFSLLPFSHASTLIESQIRKWGCMNERKIMTSFVKN
jgi:hypothetical protein